jgi:signal transduction histidine kinase
LARPLVLGAALLLAVVGALIIAQWLLGAPRNDVEQLALFLSVSGAASLLVGGSLVAWVTPRLGSLRNRVIIAFLAGLLVVLANVLTTSVLMFLSAHDLSLLFLLLGFAGAISLTFALVVSASLTSELSDLSEVATRFADGDLTARVQPRGRDELARLAEAFNDMATRLEAAFARQRLLEDGRRELVAAVSHDLRTPLATTRAMVEAVSDGVVAEPSEVRRYLRLIDREIRHLSRLIDDLFELSQIESGAVELALTRLDLVTLLSETQAAYEAQAREHDVRLQCHIEPHLPRVDADAARLQRVLRNLVDNALRYTPPGGQIELSAAEVSDAVELGVSDSGPGIPESEWQHVFERFYRGERSRARTEQPAPRLEGSGLGLAIARGLVEAHHGQIWVETSALGGAAFRVRLAVVADPD